jgi:hypothetical protein
VVDVIGYHLHHFIGRIVVHCVPLFSFFADLYVLEMNMVLVLIRNPPIHTKHHHVR